jgi:putative flippase GtrA
MSASVRAEPLDNEKGEDAEDSAPLFGQAWLTKGRVRRLFRFGVVGVSGIGVNLIVFELFFRLAHMQFAVANALGIVVSIFTNFVLNDMWTWGDRIKGGRRRDWFARLVKYYVSALAAAGVQLLVASATNAFVFAALPSEIPTDAAVLSWLPLQGEVFDVGPTLAVLTGIVFGMTINLLASHLWAFRDAEVDPQ